MIRTIALDPDRDNAIVTFNSKGVTGSHIIEVEVSDEYINQPCLEYDDHCYRFKYVNGEVIRLDDEQIKTDKCNSEYFLLRQNNLRSEAYRNESDPVFMKYQRGEATEQEWKDKIDEIKQRYPK